MQASQTPTLVPLAFAANGTKNTIPEASQIGITPGAASLNDGFPPLTFTPVAAGGVPPAGGDFNGILNLLSQTIRWKHGGGQFGYSSTFANDTNVGGYPRGALLLRSDQSGMWLNQTDNNATNPDTGGAGWSAAFVSGTVGQARNLAMSVTAASATATLAADEIVVASSLGGHKYVLAAFSKTINLATTGAGGMDTGSAPVSGYVAIYAIYNPTTQTAALLAMNSTSTKAPEVYGGANMPAGYTASALVSVWPTNSSGQFVPGEWFDRSLRMSAAIVLNTTAAQSLTALSIAAAVPLNAKLYAGYCSLLSTSTVFMTLNLWTSGVAGGVLTHPMGMYCLANAASTMAFSNAVVKSQTIGYSTTSGGGAVTFNIFVTGYTI